ncbi:MAG: hypothetical protein QOI80_1680 [Solirubrobacteraceae bacterium]|nr:hypothetical protein [Solirubrobacteraceae bacterium]
MTVEERLRRAVTPDADGARERARRVVLASAPQPTRRRRWRLVAAAAVLLGVLAVTPPGDALARWVRDLVGRDAPARVAVHLGRLPFGGLVLATGPHGVYVGGSSGRRRRLGDYESAAWSPHGRFIAVTRGDLLRAIDPVGKVRWTLIASGPVADPRWSSAGYRIAYRRDDDLRVVAGDGSGDHPLVDAVAPVPAAWRQGPANQVAVARADGDVELWAADTGARVWGRAVGAVRMLAWRPDGRLVVVTRDRVLTLAGATGRVMRERRVADGVTRAALSPTGDRVALAYDRRVTILGERAHARLVAGDTITSLTWSTEGSVLLAGTSDQWFFLPADGGEVTAGSVSGLDRVDGWCCAEGSVFLAPSFADAPDLYLRVGRWETRCGLQYVTWASTAPFRDGPRSLPPTRTVRSLGATDAVIAIVAFRDTCHPPARGAPPRLAGRHLSRSDWPGMRAGDPPLRRLFAHGNYDLDVWVFARDAAGEARTKAMLGTVRLPGEIG